MTTLSRLPTTDAYAEMQLAYDHYNRTLFAGQLPPCLITFQRKEERVSGYFPTTVSAGSTAPAPPTKSP